MNCTKCGREIPETAVFCDKCLDDMKKHPLPPGVALQLPVRKPSANPKSANRKKGPSPEEQILTLRKIIKWLTIVLLSVLLLLVLSVVLLINTLQKPADKTPATAVYSEQQWERFT